MESLLRVASGQVVILGGLMRDRSEKNRVGMPGMSSIPLIKELIGTKQHSTEKTELAIFIRPTLMTPGSLREKLARLEFSFPNEGNSPARVPALE